MTRCISYLAALFLFCHGFVYVGVGSMLPAPIEGWKGSSWLLGNSVTTSQLTKLSIGLFPGWWRPLAIAGSAVGIVAFAVFWDGQSFARHSIDELPSPQACDIVDRWK